MNGKKYLEYILNPLSSLGTKKIVLGNPTLAAERIEPEKTMIFLYEFDKDKCEAVPIETVEETFAHFDTPGITWINVEGLKKKDVEAICTHFDIHPLIIEDILSVGQRPKMDEINGIVYCLLNMLYFEPNTGVEAEQVSIVLGKNFVITFQEDSNKDVFNMLRDKIKITGSKVRQNNADFLFYFYRCGIDYDAGKT